MSRSSVFLTGMALSALALLAGLFLGFGLSRSAAPEIAGGDTVLAEIRAMGERLDARLEQADVLADRLRADLDALREQLAHGFVENRTIEITEARTAYALVEPKLMLSVEALSGGALIVNFGTQTRNIRVAQRLDFDHGDCNCFLLLAESERDRAVFEFGCERENSPAVAAAE